MIRRLLEGTLIVAGLTTIVYSCARSFLEKNGEKIVRIAVDESLNYILSDEERFNKILENETVKKVIFNMVKNNMKGA